MKSNKVKKGKVERLEIQLLREILAELRNKNYIQFQQHNYPQKPPLHYHSGKPCWNDPCILC